MLILNFEAPEIKVILVGAALDWTNKLSSPAFFFKTFLVFFSSVDLEDEDLDDIMNNNGQCPVSLSPLS